MNYGFRQMPVPVFFRPTARNRSSHFCNLPLLIVLKLNIETNEKVAGAVFQIRNRYGLSMEGETDEDGVATFRLKAGERYWLTEKKKNEGQRNRRRGYWVYVNLSGTIYVNERCTNVIIDPVATDFRVASFISFKQDKDTGRYLAGAVFRLVFWEQTLELLRSDRYGRVRFQRLYPGRYQLFELFRPGSGRGLAEPYELVVDHFGEAWINGQQAAGYRL